MQIQQPLRKQNCHGIKDRLARFEGKFVVAVRSIRTLNNKFDKFMTSIRKKVYIDKLADIVNSYNGAYHSTIKMKSISSTYIDFGTENNDKDPKFKIGEHVRTSKYKKLFAKVYAPNWSEENFMITRVKNIMPWTLVTLTVNKLLERFTKTNCKR